jgi:hypothetical protein
MTKSKKIQVTVDELACLQVNIMIQMAQIFGKEVKGPGLLRLYSDLLNETPKINLKRMTSEFHELLDLCYTADESMKEDCESFIDEICKIHGFKKNKGSDFKK